ncbi:MarR family transcriptional regulator [candidate division KSB1 bacterium]|nr:MAG: MarR family transcriptional regulator [candidate division KSB1 bacterium]
MGNLDNSLGFIIVKAARSMKRALELKLSDFNITSSQYAVLENLWEKNGISLSDLGKYLYFDNPTITGIIDRMVRDKLVMRRRDKNDRRVIKIYLTDKGRDLENILPGIADEVNREAVKNFTDKEKKDIKRLTIKIWENMAEKEK